LSCDELGSALRVVCSRHDTEMLCIGSTILAVADTMKCALWLVKQAA